MDSDLEPVTVTPPDLGSHLLELAADGKLMPWLVAPDRDETERKLAVSTLLQMHRDQQLDVLEHLGRPKNEDEWRQDFQAWAQMYRQIIPDIEEEIFKLTWRLADLATGLWEYTIQECFIDWCSRDLNRVDAILSTAIERHIPEFCVIAALVTGMRSAPSAYFDVAAEFVHGIRVPRAAGILALSATSCADEATLHRAISALRGIVEDETLSTKDRVMSLNAAIEIAQRCTGVVDSKVADIIDAATNSKQSELLRACCAVLCRLQGVIATPILDHLVLALRSINVTAPDMRESVDLAVYALLSGDRKIDVIEILEVLLVQSEDEDAFESLSTTLHHLSVDVAVTSTIVARWLLTNNRVLCMSARSLVNHAENRISTGIWGRRFAFDFDPGNAGWTDEKTVYLAKKAIGWLMPHGTAPASFLVCLMRKASFEASEQIGKLLFNPLLLNYPIATREYLEGIRAGLPDNAQHAVTAVLEHHTAYLSRLEEVGLVPELLPSAHERWIESRRQADAWAKARSAAESKSVMSTLVTKQSLLYGTHCIEYIDDQMGGVRRLDNHLKRMSHTADHVMVWVYDPSGLDLMMRTFRAIQAPE